MMKGMLSRNDGRDELLSANRDLLRFKDWRTLELQAMNQSARKISGVRELYKDYWTDHLEDDPAVLENQVKTFFDLIDSRHEGDLNETRAHRSSRLAQAVGILAEQLPVLYRGKRAAVFGTALHDAPLSPCPPHGRPSGAIPRPPPMSPWHRPP